MDKGKYRLPANERIRTDSILKRALAVEQGDATPPSLTEEHPDGCKKFILEKLIYFINAFFYNSGFILVQRRESAEETEIFEA